MSWVENHQRREQESFPAAVFKGIMRHLRQTGAENHGTCLSIARSCGAVGLHPGATGCGGSETERLQLKHGVEDPGL